MLRIIFIVVIFFTLLGCTSSPSSTVTTDKKSPADMIRDTVNKHGSRMTPETKAKLLEQANKAEMLSKKPTACGYLKGEDTEFYGPECAWMVQCTYDDIKNLKSCRITKPGLHHGITVFAFAGKKLNYLVSVGYNHHPGMTSTVRIDENSPINTSDTANNHFSKIDNERIVSEMKNGKSVASVMYTWPYTRREEERQTLQGFSDALLYAREWLIKS